MRRLSLCVAAVLALGCTNEPDGEQPLPTADAEPPLTDSDTLHLLPSGNWLEKDGVLECDGFLIRTESDDFCAAEVPDDWREFEFNGETYYAVPLS